MPRRLTSNRKRGRRFCRLYGLWVRRRKYIALHRGPAPVPVGPTEDWNMDFLHEPLDDGRPCQVLTVVDLGVGRRPVSNVRGNG